MANEESSYLAPILTPEGHLAMGYLLGAWMSFKDNHDLQSPNLKCCEKSLTLFEALNKFEALMLNKK